MTVLCTLCTVTVHTALVNITTVHSTTVLIVVVGKTNALHLVDCTSMDVDCSKEEEAVKKRQSALQALATAADFFCAHLSSLAALLTGNKKRGQAPTTDNNNIVCHDKKP